jgi:hypothetical protein
MDIASSIARLRHQRAVASEQTIPAQEALLQATLVVPLGARGVVVLPHASSAGRFARNHCFTAEVLEQSGLGTLQVDLLTPAEEASFSFANPREAETALLADRVVAVLDWLQNQAALNHLAVGVFASRIETVASLIAAERSGRSVPIVSKGGVPQPALYGTTRLSGPTLSLLGSEEVARAEELAAEFFGRHLV